MGRVAKSQWEFGELFPSAATHRVLSVSELTGQVKRLLESQIGRVWVTGEVSNLRVQSSGHAYFTLKDAGAQLSCVLFRGQGAAQRDLLADGRKVRLEGELSVYEPRGQYQLIVAKVEPEGLGALQLAFEKLKQKLQAEGLFDSARKRPIPRLPRRIGVVTSTTGAALRDVVHVIRRRHPALELVLAGCRVQGTGAAEEIARAIGRLNEFHATRAGAEEGLDLILVTRGGGSLEDLWAFNEEVVARAIVASGLPVISAVGHEIDFTIADFVADLRAATPSAAAELITEGAMATRQFLAATRERLIQAGRRRLLAEQEELERWQGRLDRVHPRRRFETGAQRVDELAERMGRAGRAQWRGIAGRFRMLGDRWRRVRPRQVLFRRAEVLARLAASLRDRVRLGRESRRQRLSGLAERLRLLSPQHVLARGYSITLDAESGRILRRAASTRLGQRLRTRLAEGEVWSRVAED